MKIFDGFRKFMEAVVVLTMAVMVIVIFLATVGRYSGLYSIPWSEECARYLMICMTYLGAMVAAARGSHFMVEVYGLLFPAKIKHIFMIIQFILVDAFSIFILLQGWSISSKMLSQGKLSPMLDLPLGAVYMVIPIGLVLMAVYYTLHNIELIRSLKVKDDGKEAE